MHNYIRDQFLQLQVLREGEKDSQDKEFFRKIFSNHNPNNVIYQVTN